MRECSTLTPTTLPFLCSLLSPSQKQLLLQEPEQYRAVEEEIRVQRMVQHPNVIQLVDSDIKDHPHGAGHAYLLFPYYRVCIQDPC